MFGGQILSVAGKLGDWYRSSVLSELADWLKTRYFTVETAEYSNLSFSNETAEKVQTVILAFAIGIACAAVMTAFVRLWLGRFVRALLKCGALSEKNAKTLKELGFFHSLVIRNELEKGANLPKIVKRAQDASEKTPSVGEPDGEKAAEETPHTEKKAPAKPEKIDFATARFFVPEDLKYRAEIRYEKKGSGVGVTALTVVLSIAAAAVLCRLVPLMMSLADGIVGLF